MRMMMITSMKMMKILIFSMTLSLKILTPMMTTMMTIITDHHDASEHPTCFLLQISETLLPSGSNVFLFL